MNHSATPSAAPSCRVSAEKKPRSNPRRTSCAVTAPGMAKKVIPSPKAERKSDIVTCFPSRLALVAVFRAQGQSDLCGDATQDAFGVRHGDVVDEMGCPSLDERARLQIRRVEVG